MTPPPSALRRRADGAHNLRRSVEEIGRNIRWVVYALLSALFAALTSILAKIGIEGVNSNLATAIRTVVVLLITLSGSLWVMYNMNKNMMPLHIEDVKNLP